MQSNIHFLNIDQLTSKEDLSGTFYLCDMYQPISLLHMVEFISQKTNFKCLFKILNHKEHYLLENYFILYLPPDEGKLFKFTPLRQCFRKRSESKFYTVKEFAASLLEIETYFQLGSRVLIPLVHRTHRGEIVDNFNNVYSRVAFRFPIAPRTYEVVAHKFDIQVPYARY